MTKLYDYTALSSLLECEQEWDYRYRQHLTRPAVEVSPHFGTAVHAGVRALFDGAPKEVVADAVAASWGDFVAPEKKAHLNLSYAQQVVEMYGEVYGLGNAHDDRVARPDGQEALDKSKMRDELSGQPSAQVALPFSLVLNERYLEQPERSLCGIVDRVVRSKQDGQLYVMDLKTTGLYLSSAWFEQWRHSLQAAIYLDLVDHMFPDEEHEVVAGFWVDAIHLDRRGYPKREDFMRVGPFPYSAELRAELRLLVGWLVNRAKGLEESPERALKNPRSCFRFNALCPFFTFCTLDPSDRADAVKMALSSGDFIAAEWKPEERK